MSARACCESLTRPQRRNATGPGARTANLPGRRFDDVFLTAMALVMPVTVFVGIAHTYYLSGLFRVPLPNRNIQSSVGVHTWEDGKNSKPQNIGSRPYRVYFPSLFGGINANKLCLVGHNLTATQQDVALRMFRTSRLH
jgi:hypothetical protein